MLLFVFLNQIFRWIQGLDVLNELDSRFGKYRNTLFSHTSLEVDREKMVPKEEEKLNISIRSYLRLLSGHLQTPAALKTLEYLIRRYKYSICVFFQFMVFDSWFF